MLQRSPIQYILLRLLNKHYNVTASDLVSIGNTIFSTMDGKDVFTHSFRGSDKAKSLASVSRVRVGDDKNIHRDPALLFQRLYLVANAINIDIEEVMKNELCAYPMSLFEAPKMLRMADKPPLAAIHKYVDKTSRNVIMPDQQMEQYALDGGSLLHRIPWQKGQTLNGCIVINEVGDADVTIDKACVGWGIVAASNSLS
jgi:hypothetical protein